jgi:hypothetical protein
MFYLWPKALHRADFPPKESFRLCIYDEETGKSGQGPTMGYRAIHDGGGGGGGGGDDDDDDDDYYYYYYYYYL